MLLIEKEELQTLQKKFNYLILFFFEDDEDKNVSVYKRVL